MKPVYINNTKSPTSNRYVSELKQHDRNAQGDNNIDTNYPKHTNVISIKQGR